MIQIVMPVASTLAAAAGKRTPRHTVWCGQSASTKTYPFGVVLEQILVNTGLAIVIFDPNADFVRLGEV